MAVRTHGDKVFRSVNLPGAFTLGDGLKVVDLDNAYALFAIGMLKVEVADGTAVSMFSDTIGAGVGVAFVVCMRDLICFTFGPIVLGCGAVKSCGIVCNLVLDEVFDQFHGVIFVLN